MKYQTIKVKHNMEMAHRLSQTPGKCENIHGHSWWCTLSLTGPLNKVGMVLEFGSVKTAFREYLDETYDHHLLLNESDDILTSTLHQGFRYPGLFSIPCDPTTENIANMIYQWANHNWLGHTVGVELWETAVNCARIGDFV